MRPTPLALLALLSCSFGLAEQPKQPPPAFDGNYQHYWDNACARCHGADGSGKDNNGRDLPDRGHDLTDMRVRRGQKKWPDVILAGKEKMPAFKDKLTGEQVKSLVEWITKTFAASS